MGTRGAPPHTCITHALPHHAHRSYPALKASGHYPIAPGTALLSRGLAAVRRAGTYERCASQGEVTVITAVMPCGAADRRPPGGWAGSTWACDVASRIRAVLHVARHAGAPGRACARSPPLARPTSHPSFSRPLAVGGRTPADVLTCPNPYCVRPNPYAGHPNVVLGAFGCGAFGNPAGT